MNAQLPITTTPKYNFPLQNTNLQAPQQLIELSIRSLKKPQPPQSFLTTSKDSQQLIPKTNLIHLKPNPTKTAIVAIDVSSIRLGETEIGVLLAARGAIVWKQTNGYHYLRLGPFPFHITGKNKNEIYSLLHHQPPKNQEYTTPNIVHIQSKITMLLERWIQTSINQITLSSLILLDGSLTAGTPETPIKTMEHLLKTARMRQNSILAFSKMTRLMFCGRRLTDLMYNHSSPCLLELPDYPDCMGSIKLMGNIYVAKLGGYGCAFRLDVDKDVSHIQTIESVQKLLGNDLISQGYPETLRLAHIFSTFTATEVLALQRCLAKESNIEIITRPNIRRILFGRFSKGPEG